MHNYKESKIRFGVVSASGMAQNHMMGIKMNPQAELVSICDIDDERLEKAGLRLGVDRLYTSCADMLEKEELDAVVIATPDQLHAEHAVAALEAGKHVLCEKPMALKIDECRAMIDASERTGRKLMIGQICRFTPGFKKAKEIIAAGGIGKLFFVESEYAHDYTNVVKENSWRLDPLRHGVIGGGCHAVDLIKWIAGNPYQVCAFSNRILFPGWPTDDCTISILKFPHEVIGKVFVSVGCKRNYTMRSVFYGDKGTIIATNTMPYITLYKHEFGNGPMQEEYLSQETGMNIPVDISSHNTVAEIDEFIDTISNDRPVATDGRQGADTVAVCLAIIDSANRNEILSVDYNY